VTFNQQYFDATLRHQIDLLRYGTGVARKVNGILDETLVDIRKQVERRLGKTTGLDATGLRRLRELERAINQTRSPAWNDVTAEWERQAIDVALEEPLFIGGTLTSALPVELDLVTPSDATLRALATTRPFQGKTLKEWADSARRADLTRIHQQIRIGMTQGESAKNIANRVFGAKGAMQITRGQTEAVTRTVISGVSNAAQQAFLADNSDLFDAEQLVATLDSRTTPICRALDGHQYPVGEGPIPPLHVACRSLRVAVIDGEVVGERPFKAGTQQQMLREYAEAKGLSGIKSRDDLPRGTKGDFDAFSRRRMRELTGQVPARTTYQQWLQGQPAEIQDDILGPKRGKLFREGGLTLDRFVNRQGDELTLDEIRERNEAEWKRSGLGQPDPGRAEREAAERQRAAAEAEAERERQAAEDRRRAEAAEREAERLRKEAEEAERLRIEAEQDAEMERLREQFQRAEREKQQRAAAVSQRLANHAQVVALVEEPEAKFKRLAADTIDRIRPAQTPRLGRLEIHRARSIRVNAFGADTAADGVYYPVARDLQLATDLPAPGRTLVDWNFGVSDSAKSQDQAFEMLVTHEYGHHIHMSTGEDSEVDRIVRRAYKRAAPAAESVAHFNEMPTKDVDPEGSPSVYGTANHYEFFAESFTAYHHDRDWLKANKPVAHEMVETVLGLLK
jgi:SPP1 gp7 family putative phage head morphogenesis protein